MKAKLEVKDLAIELTIPGRRDTEIIIVKYSNLEYKLGYYINNYDEQLVLNRCKDIKIVDAYTINSNILKRK